MLADYVRATSFRLFAIAAVFALTACSGLTPSPNAPLSPAAFDPSDNFISQGGYRYAALPDGANSPELLVIVSFSGGGKRSSAFGYGVLKGLRDTEISVGGRQHSLLDEVDIMTSVSGGSFVAAYYGLYRDKIFTNFADDFLYRDVEAYMWGTFLLPWNWEWMVNPAYGTNDRMQEIYDEFMFHGATYADMNSKGRPLISINATDVSYGTVFPFTQDQFDLICSDLEPFPVARAVAASNGFPVLFTPITLIDYNEKCGGRTPRWVREAKSLDPLSRRSQLAQSAQAYLDPAQTEYVHLMDGGIADNLAMRSIINATIALSDDQQYIRAARLDRVRRVLLISADGQAIKDTSKAKMSNLSGLDQIFDAVSGTQIDSYNFETMILADEELEKLRGAIEALLCGKAGAGTTHCRDVQVHFVHLSLAKIADPAERALLEHIPTGLTLEKADVDRLAAAGEAVVHGSPALLQFTRSLSDVK